MPGKHDMWSLRDILSWTTKRFSRLGLPSPRLDAELLIAHALRLKRIQLYTSLDKPLDYHERDTIRAFVRRRLKREPVAYITGCKEFYSLPFCVARGVLIPRPETEALIQAVRAVYSSRQPLLMLDLGAGSGNIGITLARLFSNSRIVMVEKDARATAVCSKNIRRLAGSNTLLLRADIRSLALAGPVFDALVSNPPYIPESDMPGLAPEIRRYENPRALAAAADGCAFIAPLLYLADKLLRMGGRLFLEFPERQLPRVALQLKLFASLNICAKITDYAGNCQGVVIGKQDG